MKGWDESLRNGVAYFISSDPLGNPPQTLPTMTRTEVVPAVYPVPTTMAIRRSHPENPGRLHDQRKKRKLQTINDIMRSVFARDFVSFHFLSVKKPYEGWLG